MASSSTMKMLQVLAVLISVAVMVQCAPANSTKPIAPQSGTAIRANTTTVKTHVVPANSKPISFGASSSVPVASSSSKVNSTAPKPPSRRPVRAAEEEDEGPQVRKTNGTSALSQLTPPKISGAHSIFTRNTPSSSKGNSTKPSATSTSSRETSEEAKEKPVVASASEQLPVVANSGVIRAPSSQKYGNSSSHPASAAGSSSSQGASVGHLANWEENDNFETIALIF